MKPPRAGDEVVINGRPATITAVSHSDGDCRAGATWPVHRQLRSRDDRKDLLEKLVKRFGAGARRGARTCGVGMFPAVVVALLSRPVPPKNHCLWA